MSRQIKQHPAALVTGATRGLGRALVEALLARGAAKVYAAGRNRAALEPVVALDPARVVPVTLDVTDAAQAEAAAQQAGDASLVISNAGVLSSFGVLDAPLENVRRDMDTNFFGTLNVARAFAPVLRRHDGAALVNVLSIAALGSLPMLGGYSASKAAAWSLTQSLRADLGKSGVRVHAVLAGLIDTDMARGFDLPKTSAADVASATLDGIEAGTLDITPDAYSTEAVGVWAGDPRAFAKRFAG
jgi:NAD(P)-dependent dehydrogenase (short-subunit alcohol dehydrogenase family)